MKIRVFGSEINVFLFAFLLLLSISLIGGCSYRVLFLVNVQNYEKAYKWDRRDGTITPLERSGWHNVVPLITKIRTVDTRPVQIKIEASLGSGVNNRVLNAKLVRFNPEGAQQLFDFHGFANYDQSDLQEILKIYAYEDCATSQYNPEQLQKKYKFLKIIGETSGTGEKDFFTDKIDSTYEKNTQ